MTSEAAAKKDTQKLQRAIVDGLEDVKAQDIQVFNTEHLSPLFERVIVASGTSNRQTKALASSVRDAVREAGFPKPRTEGEENGEWIIVDCGAAVAHIMQPAIRQYYHLEEIWGEKPVRIKFGAEKPATAAEEKAATPAAKNPLEQSKGNGSVQLYVDTDKKSSEQKTTLDGGAGGVKVSGGSANAAATAAAALAAASQPAVSVSRGANGQANLSAVVPLPAQLPAGKAPVATTADGKPLPAWLKFDPATGTFNGNPPPGFKGDLKVSVSVPQADGSTRSVPVNFPVK